MGIVSIVKDNSISLMDQGNVVLRMTETIEDNAVEVALEGDMRSDTAHALGDELKTLVLLEKDLTLNLQKATGLSTSCCQAFLSIQQTIDNNEKGSMKLIGVPAVLLAKMGSSGLTALLQIEDAKEK